MGRKEYNSVDINYMLTKNENTQIKNSCNLCRGEKLDLFKSKLRDEKEKFKVFRCEKCGHIQLFPKPSEEDNKEFYDKNLQDIRRQKEISYEKLLANNKFDTDRHVNLIKELTNNDINSSILDIGAGYGFFVDALTRAGYKNVTGIEISIERRQISMQHTNVAIIDFDINNPNIDIGTFDVVTLFHVLEHIDDPIKFLKNIYKLLNKNGILVCEVPNVREILLDVCKEYNDFYWIRAHLNYFSSTTLLDCFKKAGYHKVEIRFEQRYGLINLCNWLTTGLPQIEKPIFEIVDDYKDVENFYRKYLESIGRSDTIIAITKI